MSRVSIKWVRKADTLILTSLLWFMALFLRYVLPPLFGTFQVQYDVSQGELGLAYSALMVAYSTMQFPGGWLADRLGTIKVIVGGAAVFGAAALLISLSLTWYGLVAGLVLIGVGTGGHKTVSLPLLSNRYPSSPGRMLGVMDMIGQFGGVAGPAAVVAIEIFGIDWRVIFLLSAVVVLLLAATFFGQHYWRFWENHATNSMKARGRSDDPDNKMDDNDTDDSYFVLFANSRFTLFIAATVFIAFCWNGATAFMPLYLTDHIGLSSTFSNGLFGLLFAASLAQPLFGELSDRIGQLHVMAVAVTASTLAVVGLLVVENPLIIGLCVLCFGIGMHGYRPVRDAYLAKLVPDSVAGGIFGVVRTIMVVSGSLSSFIVGVLIDFASYTVAFAVLTGSVFVSIVLFVGLLLTT